MARPLGWIDTRTEVPLEGASTVAEDHPEGVQLTDKETTPPGSTSDGWRVPGLIAVALIGCVAVAGLYVLRHYKVGYFADYQRGYAAVSLGTSPGTGTPDPACYLAVQAAYPEALAGATGATWPQNAQAFYAGCVQKSQGQPLDVWTMHGYLTSGRD